jgi:hypothetical protein
MKSREDFFQHGAACHAIQSPQSDKDIRTIARIFCGTSMHRMIEERRPFDLFSIKLRTVLAFPG